MSRIFFLARTSRCASVVSGTRKGPCYFRRAQAAQQSEGQANLGVGRQCRVTAGEDKSQSVVFHSGSVGCQTWSGNRIGRIGSHQLTQRLDLLRQPLGAADPIDGLTARSRRDPCAGIGRHPVDRPMLEGGNESVLDGFLRQVEVSGCADQTGYYPARLLSEDTVDGVERERAGVPDSAASDAATVNVSQRPSPAAWPPQPARCLSRARFPGSPTPDGPRSSHARHRGSWRPT